MERKVYMILNFCWAVIGDCDLGSESLRFMGNNRYWVWGTYRVLNTIKYPGSVSYKGYSVTNRNQILDYEIKSDFSLPPLGTPL
jgi:hypothetical protein